MIELTEQEIDQISGGIPPLAYIIAAVIVRKYTTKVVKTAVAGASAGAVGAALRED